MARTVVSGRLDVASRVDSRFNHTFWMPDCGKVLTVGAKSAPPEDCSSKCVGNANQICGGNNRLNLYWSGATPPPQPTFVSSVDQWRYVGCYRYAYTHSFFVRKRTCDGCVRFANSDSNDRRFLTVRTIAIGGVSNNSVESCIGACEGAGYPLAGVEFANECCTCFTSESSL